jgi:hypothetical protein
MALRTQWIARLLRCLSALILCSAFGPGPISTASAAPVVATVADGKLTVSPLARDAAYNAASSAVYAAPDGKGMLVVGDPARIVVNADVLAGSGGLATFDATQAKAFSRLFLTATTAYYRGETGAIADAGKLLWNGLYATPTSTADLSTASAAVLSAVGGNGVPTAAVDQLRAVLMENFATLGVTLALAPTPPSGPIVVNNGSISVNATFASDGYFAASGIVRDPDPDLTVAKPTEIGSAAAGRASSFTQPVSAKAYISVLGFSFAAYNGGTTQPLRDAGKAVFDSLQTTLPSKITVTALVDVVIRLQQLAVTDGRLRSQATATAIHDLLASGLTGMGVNTSLPSAPPVPDWTLIATTKDGKIGFDSMAQTRLYFRAYNAALQPRRTLSDADTLNSRVAESLADPTGLEDMNTGQVRAYTSLMAVSMVPYWTAQTDQLIGAGRTLFDLLMSSTPVNVGSLIAASRSLYEISIRQGQYPHWPSADALGRTIVTALGGLGVAAQMPTLTDLFGTDTRAAKSALPGTDFGVATATGGEVRNADAWLRVPAGCVGPSLISVTTMAITPVRADLTIHAPWSCRPTVALRATDTDAATFLAWNPPGTTDLTDVPAATTNEGWATASVDRLGMYEDAEPSLVARMRNLVDATVILRSGPPDCTGVGSSSSLVTVVLDEPVSDDAPWRVCQGLANGQANARGAFNLSVCATVTTSPTPGVRHAIAYEDAFGAVVCPATQISVTAPQGSSASVDVASHVGITLADHGVHVVGDALGRFGGPVPNMSSFQSAMAGCLGSTLNQPSYRGGVPQAVMGDTLETCVGRAAGLPVSLRIDIGGRPAKSWAGSSGRSAKALGKALAQASTSGTIKADLARGGRLTLSSSLPASGSTGLSGVGYSSGGGSGAGGGWYVPVNATTAPGCASMRVSPLQDASGIPSNHNGPLFVDAQQVNGCFAAARGLAGYANVGGSDNGPHRWGGGYVQDFSRGAWGWNLIMVRDNAGQAFIIRQGMWETYRNTDGISRLGYPIGNEYNTADGAVQLFERGMIAWESGRGRIVGNAPPDSGAAELLKTACYGQWSPRGYAGQNCTDYVAWRLAKAGHGIPGGMGNGGEWGATFPGRLGWRVDGIPRPGDVAWKAGNPGHVAYVRVVNPNGSLEIEDWNNRAVCAYGQWSNVSPTSFSGFIHPPVNSWN